MKKTGPRQKARFGTPKKLIVAMTMASALPQGASALSFEPSDGVTIDWDTTLTYGAAWRVEDRDPALLADPNGDDGNRNFDKGLISNRVGLVTEVDANFGQVGAFVRGRAYYDDVYHKTTDHDSPGTSNNLSVPFNEFTDATKELHGSEVELLDAFLYTDIPVGDRSLNLRLGRQVVSWGESLFVANGVSSAQAPVDATKLNVPGVELKEIFLPVGQVFGQIELTDSVSVEAYYQYDWEKTTLDGAGSYFSTADVIDDGGESFIVVPGLFSATRGADRPASDSGQYGVALRYVAESLNDTEFGFYHINYHDKTPQLVAADFVPLGPSFAPSTYHLEYVEDIKLYGASFGTVLGDTNLGGDLTYRTGQPVGMAGPLPSFELGDVMQAQLSFIHIFGGNALMDDLTVMGEAAYNRVLDLDNGDINNLAKDRSAWGYQVRMTPKYFDWMTPGLELSLPITFKHNVNGVSSLPGSWAEGADSLNVAAKFTYLGQYQADIGYTAFLGNASEDAKSDRDMISMSFKYSF